MKTNDPFDELLRTLEENLGRDRDSIPPDGIPPSREPGQRPNMRRWLWPAILFLLFILGGRLINFAVDWTWFSSVGFASVYWTRYVWWSVLFVVGALLFFVFFLLNIVLARRLEPWGLTDTPLQQVAEAFGLRVTPLVVLAGAGVALLMGMSVAAVWEMFALFSRQGSFDLADPLFNRDVGFFIFTLPVMEFVRSWLLMALGATLIGVVIVSGVGWRGWQVRRGILMHIAALAAMILLLFAWQYRLNAFELVYSERGAVIGAGYTDINAQLPAYNLLIIITAIAAVVLLVVAWLGRGWRAIGGVMIAWLVIAVVAGSVYPSLVQRFQVRPNELNLETPYIADNIRFTRLGFDLDDIEVLNYDASEQLTVDGLLGEPDTLRNIRLWDYRPLLSTYNQVQALRQYYVFNDVDIDRYTIDGQRTQVMLAARELVTDRLNPDAQTWVNQRLVYTHGYGVAASPVSKVTGDGLPEFLLKDLPTTGVITVTQPQIYFGERTDSYVIGATSQPEFDYPREDGNVTNSFSAKTGIAMSWWNRLLFALHLADVNLLLSSDISAESQLLWRRNITERIEHVAPFLLFDSDPYIVVSEDGRLFWILDAFTASNRFPYSEPQGGINYIRNSVKIVTNAYDGVMTFYLADDDPIIAAYQRVFPDLFQPLSNMPEDLRDNVRYPEDLLTVQANAYRTYHMTNPAEFYNKEDMWAWPEEIFENEPVRVEPYPVLMQLPDQNSLDYVQILPYTPSNRENMVAWLAVQNDPEKYGQKLVYRFGKDSLFFGPKQIEARIDQDATISSQLTLWNQQGSSVIRGNLLVFPMASSLLYVEPLYLQSASGKIPELKRVVVATADSVVMAENLGLALVKLFGEDLLNSEVLLELGARALGAAAAQTDGTQLNGNNQLVTIEQLVQAASERYQRAQEALRGGDWAGYGVEIDALGELLAQLATFTGVPLAEPTPEPTPVTAP
jgi:uncharacterized membrane protein (UPF0182 family)